MGIPFTEDKPVTEIAEGTMPAFAKLHPDCLQIGSPPGGRFCR
jgi:hypothetical protein